MRIRELRDGLEVEDDEREAAASGGEDGGGSGEVVAVVRLRAKRALVGAGARVLFYPTLLYNVLRNRFDGEFRWWDRVDQVYMVRRTRIGFRRGRLPCYRSRPNS